MLTKLVPPNIQLLAGRVDRQGLTETDVEEGHIPGAVFSPLVPCTMVSGQAMFTSESNACHGIVHLRSLLLAMLAAGLWRAVLLFSVLGGALGQGSPPALCRAGTRRSGCHTPAGALQDARR